MPVPGDRPRGGFAAESSANERVLGIFDSLREWFATPSFRGCAFVSATVELADPQHPAHEAILEYRTNTREWVAELLIECGGVDPQFVARQIVQLMEGAITTALLEQDPAAADIARASAAQILVANGAD